MQDTFRKFFSCLHGRLFPRQTEAMRMHELVFFQNVSAFAFVKKQLGEQVISFLHSLECQYRNGPHISRITHCKNSWLCGRRRRNVRHLACANRKVVYSPPLLPIFLPIYFRASSSFFRYRFSFGRGGSCLRLCYRRSRRGRPRHRHWRFPHPASLGSGRTTLLRHHCSSPGGFCHRSRSFCTIGKRRWNEIDLSQRCEFRS